MTTSETNQTATDSQDVHVVGSACPILESPELLTGKILVIDDQAAGRAVIREVLDKHLPNCTVRLYADAASALHEMREQMPDLVIIDYQMPGMNGIETIKKMRLMQGLECVPVLMVTVAKERNVLYEAFNAGATDFLRKPVDEIELRARTVNLLRVQKYARDLLGRAWGLERQINLHWSSAQQRENELLRLIGNIGDWHDNKDDQYHERIGLLSKALGRVMGMSEIDCETLLYAAPLHDMGKIGVYRSALRKEGELTAEEQENLRQHPLIGHELLSRGRGRVLSMGAVICLNHREHWDGAGYPQGIGGEDIPLPARVVAVACVFDALRRDRPGRHKHNLSQAFEVLTQEAGKTLDPACVEAFLGLREEIIAIDGAFRPGG